MLTFALLQEPYKAIFHSTFLGSTIVFTHHLVLGPFSLHKEQTAEYFLYMMDIIPLYHEWTVPYSKQFISLISRMDCSIFQAVHIPYIKNGWFQIQSSAYPLGQEWTVPNPKLGISPISRMGSSKSKVGYIPNIKNGQF